jgi:hypothetical protein
MLGVAGLLAASLAGCAAEDIAGEEVVDGDPAAPLAQLSSALGVNHQLDTTFNDTGMAFAPSVAGWASAVADAGGGKVAFTANADIDNRPMAIVGRVTASGGRDTTWDFGQAVPGHDRFLNDDLVADSAWANDLLVVSKKTFVAGTAVKFGIMYGYVAELDEHGKPVTAFDQDGFAKFLPPGCTSFAAYQLERNADGQLLVAGICQTDDTSKAYVEVGRLSARTGAIDESYGSHGWAGRLSPDPTFPPELAPRIAVGRDSEVVVAVSKPAQGKLFRFDSSGDYDTTFGTKTMELNISDVAATVDGRVFALHGFDLFAYKSNGQLDTRFDDWPRGYLDIPEVQAFATTNVVFSQALGRIYVTGHGYVLNANHSERQVIATVALRPDGALDTSFGEGGRVLTDFPGVLWERTFAMALQGTKLIVAGAHFTGELHAVHALHHHVGDEDREQIGRAHF